MQAALPAVPLPDAQTVSMAVLFFMAGMAVPTRFGIERLEGVGRAGASKLPYQPPPGQDEGQAMADAVDEGGGDG